MCRSSLLRVGGRPEAARPASVLSLAAPRPQARPPLALAVDIFAILACQHRPHRPRNRHARQHEATAATATTTAATRQEARPRVGAVVAAAEVQSCAREESADRCRGIPNGTPCRVPGGIVPLSDVGGCCIIYFLSKQQRQKFEVLESV